MNPGNTGIENAAEFPRLVNLEKADPASENESPGALAGATGAEFEGSECLESYKVRHGLATLLCRTINACHPRDAVPIMVAALGENVAHHVAKGGRWNGRKVSKGRVLYLAAEGGAAFLNRVAALDKPELWVLPSPLTLVGDGAQVRELVEMVLHLTAVGGAPFDLIVIDTLARVMGGEDENLAPAIAKLMRALDYIRRATGAHVMLVHHSGKDGSRGARGHSSLRAAIDTEIALTRGDHGPIAMEVTKQRDGPTGDKFHFTLLRAVLGKDQDGDDVTTCTVGWFAPGEDLA